MKTSLSRTIRLGFVAVSAIVSCSAFADYTFTTIDYQATPPSVAVNSGFWGTSLNGKLMILNAQIDDNSASFIYDATAKSFTRVPPPPAPYQEAFATGINDYGVVVGQASDGQNGGQAFIFDHGTWTFYSREGWENSSFRSINNSGMITGLSSHIIRPADEPVSVGFIFDRSTGQYTDISVPGASLDATIIVHGINSAGQAVGSAKPYHNLDGPGVMFSQSFLRQPDGTLTLFTLSGGFQGYGWSQARGINDNGQISAVALDANGNQQIFVGNASNLKSGFQMLSVPAPSIPNAVWGYTEGINNQGQVVGWWTDAYDVTHGMVSALIATGKDDCKGSNWQVYARANLGPFKNQGDCIQYVNTGK